jgi:hypothetical protein
MNAFSLTIAKITLSKPQPFADFHVREIFTPHFKKSRLRNWRELDDEFFKRILSSMLGSVCAIRCAL